mgnify:CR=1 FL=1
MRYLWPCLILLIPCSLFAKEPWVTSHSRELHEAIVRESQRPQSPQKQEQLRLEVEARDAYDAKLKVAIHGQSLRQWPLGGVVWGTPELPSNTRTRLVGVSPLYAWLETAQGEEIKIWRERMPRANRDEPDWPYMIWVQAMAALKRNQKIKWPAEAMLAPERKPSRNSF